MASLTPQRVQLILLQPFCESRKGAKRTAMATPAPVQKRPASAIARDVAARETCFALRTKNVSQPRQKSANVLMADKAAVYEEQRWNAVLACFATILHCRDDL